MRALIAIVLTAAALARAAEPFEARWDGTVQIPGNELHVVIDLAKSGGPNDAGQWTGSAIVPGYGVKGAALTGIVVQGAAISFTLKGALGGPKFSGRLNPDGSFAGEFQQSGNTATFRLVKSGPPQVDPPRLGTAVGKELEGDWQGVDVPQYRMTFEARWRKDVKELTGTFAQGPMETPLALHPAAK